MKIPRYSHFLSILFYTFALSFTGLLKASELTVEVTDTHGMSLKDAVVYLEGENINQKKDNKTIEIEQKGKQFHPLVTVVQTGTSINFPNHDRVRHHVYSFSPAKKFELKLYSGIPANPILFDKAGTVVLGCNIHDNMLAYVYVVDTPLFSQTDVSGLTKLTNLPDGHYRLKVWHYALKNENVPLEQDINIKPNMSKILVKLEINNSELVKDR